MALKLFLFAALMVIALAADEVPQKKPTAEILSENSIVRQDGYNFEFKTSDGVSRKEEAELIKVGNSTGIAVKGSYSYTAPDGEEYLVTFTADDKGYKPEIHAVPKNTQ